ncbi:glycoside hydrolase family protein [Hymenobacter sp. GOD-10R]|uniref:glycoside hydrolase family protein n=1 Tax=Hymenobacter sp. GOD-10R TaxID=3093922 RepID=UPI002D79A7D8|nr:glycoside hydrolase family protein [Hymenobacter sp. GOD-10R]WRQ30317.1 glycoside hydrolase family protein [Hymenobacter sp. GOD-10R]
MLTRRDFIAGLALAPVARAVAGFTGNRLLDFPKNSLSKFSKHLHPVGRALEMPDWYVWCNSPIYGPDGKVHVFFSRWPAKRGMGGWINSSEIAHAVGDSPEGPFQYLETVLAPRGPGFWDATTCHNPHIQFVDGKYCLFFMGNSNGKTDTKRIGLATADSLNGPWKRPDQPLLLPGETGAWDDHCTTNPAFVKLPNGQYWLYYKSWNTADYVNSKDPVIRGNRKYGLAIADQLEGPYVKYAGNPVVDFSKQGNNKQFEDAYVWRQHNKFHMLARDMGVYSQEVGLYLESEDGKKWDYPLIAFFPVRDYLQEPPAPANLKRYGRLERPQLLMRNGKPEYMFCASQGGKAMTASSFMFRIS